MSRAVARPRAAVIGLWTGVGAIALLLRAQGMHRGLIFPDGYDYLLMARGIATHLTPTVRSDPAARRSCPPSTPRSSRCSRRSSRC